MVLDRIIKTIKQIRYLKTSYKKCVDLFCIIFKLELDQDISEVCTKFQRVSIIRFGEFRTESQVPTLTKFSSLCKLTPKLVVAY